MPAALSIATVKLCPPAASAAGAKLQVDPVTVALPRRRPPSYTATTSPAARVPATAPLRIGSVSLVMPPLATLPVIAATSSAAAVIVAVAVGTLALTVTT